MSELDFHEHGCNCDGCYARRQWEEANNDAEHANRALDTTIKELEQDENNSLESCWLFLEATEDAKVSVNLELELSLESTSSRHAISELCCDLETIVTRLRRVGDKLGV